MNWKKIAIACICIYLAIAIPMYLANQQAVEKCYNAPREKGFDLVVGATGFGENIQCRYYNSNTREERNISIG